MTSAVLAVLFRPFLGDVYRDGGRRPFGELQLARYDRRPTLELGRRVECGLSPLGRPAVSYQTNNRLADQEQLGQ